jgi:transketolase
MLKVSRRGHLGPALSILEILRVLYDDILKYDPENPKWPDRDRCILSKGHGYFAMYVLLAEKGFFPVSELEKFCTEDGILGIHPEYGRIPGVEITTGSLGHGLSIGVGFALNAKYEKKSYRVFVILGDGECNEGSVWEAAMCASKHALSNLIAIIDYNKQQAYGSTHEVQELEPFRDKWEAFGFAVGEVDGHDIEALRNMFRSVPLEEDRPSAIICHTVKGRGISFAEGNLEWHHKRGITDEEIELLLKALETD